MEEETVQRTEKEYESEVERERIKRKRREEHGAERVRNVRCGQKRE